jgi:hypothetical protein
MEMINSKRVLQVCCIAILVLLAFVGLGPAKWQPRSGLGWGIDHFAGLLHYHSDVLPRLASAARGWGSARDLRWGSARDLRGTAGLGGGVQRSGSRGGGYYC